MSAQTQKVDVLANIKDAIRRTSPTTHFNERANLWATHDAMAALIQASAGALADLDAMVAAADRGEVWVVNAGTRLRLEELRAALAGASA